MLMPSLIQIIIYLFLFFLIYYQVFILLTFFEHRKNIHNENHNISNSGVKNGNNGLATLLNRVLPSVTILVPIFNEEKTVEKTLNSLLDINYPKDKLKIMVVDDGSKDNTWNIVQRFKNEAQITLHKKANGGKYTALNYGIEHCHTDLIGCLDADSMVSADALNHIVPYFDNPEIMAVTPSMKIQNPNTLLGMIQNAEYNLGIFLRKLMGIIDAQYVTPGPFSIFRRSVFDTVGNYRHAHNTEDLEMALRLQNHHMKITCAHKAVVYTVGPRTVYALYKQRVRWTGGFIQNALDYKHMILNPEYGNLGMLVLPAAMWGILGTLFATFYFLIQTTLRTISFINTTNALGWGARFNSISFNLTTLREYIYYHVQGTIVLSIFAYGLIAFAVYYGKKLANVPDSKKMDTVYFIMIYSFIAPIWLFKSVYNTIRRRDANWR
jgi:cellulose synthase/poly-beta-1,6-N-acetylglucosamine synthase-like glycosyltransferase